MTWSGFEVGPLSVPDTALCRRRARLASWRPGAVRALPPPSLHRLAGRGRHRPITPGVLLEDEQPALGDPGRGSASPRRGFPHGHFLPAERTRAAVSVSKRRGPLPHCAVSCTAPSGRSHVHCARPAVPPPHAAVRGPLSGAWGWGTAPGGRRAFPGVPGTQQAPGVLPSSRTECLNIVSHARPGRGSRAGDTGRRRGPSCCAHPARPGAVAF